jgi:predicted hydrocarbon binding protein
MPNGNDFEQAWLSKLSQCLSELAGEEIRKEVMAGSERLSAHSNREHVIAWSQQAMEKLDSLVDHNERKLIMTGCACQYPKSDLHEIREAYEETRDFDLAHRMLQEKFESFLRDDLSLTSETIDEIVSKGWGLAGIKEGNQIVATKIPKSGYLKDYMEETNPDTRRQYYCHCPRVRDIVKTSETISPTYCYCGAGFYKGIWEEILQRTVGVEVVETVLSGDEVCRIVIQLPIDL